MAVVSEMEISAFDLGHRFFKRGTFSKMETVESEICGC